MLMEFARTREFVYLLIAIFSIITFVFLCKKYKLSNYQILIFVLLVLFWSTVIIFRSFRRIYAMAPLDAGGLGLEDLASISIVSIYGFISIFVRLPIFMITDYFKSRIFFIRLSMIAVFITSLLVYYNPNYITLWSSSLAIGIAASFLSLFNVMFAETFDSKKAIFSVSILSIAPLIAEFLTSPIQYFVLSDSMPNYKNLWLFSCGMVLLVLILLFFIKDNKKLVMNFSFTKVKTVLKTPGFIFFCILGIFISLIRFSTSATNYVALVSLEEINMGAFGIAYSGVLYTIAQLFAGILMGIYLKPKIGIKKTLLIGLGSTLIFTVLPIITTNPILLFLTYGFNGIGYGLLYNILLGLVMELFNKEYREISMGIFQTFFAIGIYYGDRIHAIIYKLFITNNIYQTFQNVYLLISIIVACLFIFICLFFKNKQKELSEGSN